MDIDRLKQKSRSAHMFEGIAGPTAQDMADIEAGHEDTGVFTAEQVEGLRRMNEKIDPAYARQRSAKRGGTGGGIKSRGDAVGTLSMMRKIGGDSEAGEALGTLEGQFGVTDKKGKVSSGGITGGAEMGSSGDDPAASRPALKAVGMGDISASSGYFGRHKDTPEYQSGLMLLRTAGRCNHPRCQMIRAKGMELTGADRRYQTGGQFWESKQAPIPSIATEKKGYPIVDGKESRKGVYTYNELSPADPNHPEWLAATKEAKSGTSIYDPSDLLEHHHGPEDADFEKHPLPWM